jgi:anthranilate/para-aminobenzoate synthase component I
LDSRGYRQASPQITIERENPFAVLRRLFDIYRLEVSAYDECPIPLLSGAVGYFGYEAAHFLEDLPARAEDDLNLPDIYLMFFNRVLAHCHETGKNLFNMPQRGKHGR